MLKKLLLKAMGYSRIDFVGADVYYPKSANPETKMLIEVMKKIGTKEWHYGVEYDENGKPKKIIGKRI